jgi:hypothetical protein
MKESKAIPASLEGVRSQGWTPAELRLAVARLSEIVADQAPRPDDQPAALAIELLRWLRYACEIDPGELVEYLEHRKPLSPNAPERDALDALFHRHDSLAELVVELSRRYADPVRILMQFLDAVAPRGKDYLTVLENHRKTYEVLWAFRTDESLTCALSRLDLMNWEADEDELGDHVRQQGEAIRRIAVATWASFSWEQRNDVTSLFEQYQLYDEGLLELLLSADLRSMSPDDRRHYVWSLGDYRDTRTVARIRAVLDWALDDLATIKTDSAKDLVCSAMTQLAERGLGPTNAQRERAEISGVRWHHPMDRGGTGARYEN